MSFIHPQLMGPKYHLLRSQKWNGNFYSSMCLICTDVLKKTFFLA